MKNKLLLLVLIVGCKSVPKFDEKEYDRVKSCYDSWTYGFLKKNLNEVTVFDFENRDTTKLIGKVPAFCIVYDAMDTFGIMDPYFKGEIAENDRLSLLAIQDSSLLSLRPTMHVYLKKKKRNNVICSVKEVKLCHFKKLN